MAACLNLIGRIDFYYYSDQVFDRIQVFLVRILFLLLLWLLAPVSKAAANQGSLFKIVVIKVVTFTIDITDIVIITLIIIIITVIIMIMMIDKTCLIALSALALPLSLPV